MGLRSFPAGDSKGLPKIADFNGDLAQKLGRGDFRQKCFENRQPKNLGRETKKMDKASGFLVDFGEFKIDSVLSHNPHWNLGFWGVESGSPEPSRRGLKVTPQNRRFQWGFGLKTGSRRFSPKCFENHQPKNLGRETKKMDKASGFLVDFGQFKIDSVLNHNPH